MAYLSLQKLREIAQNLAGIVCVTSVSHDRLMVAKGNH